jgi:pimeloyl-ACP methyl ester carboxylesterase
MPRRTMIPLTALTLLAALAVAQPPASVADRADATTTAESRWQRCDGNDHPPEMRCTTMTVPVNWARPGGRTIAVPVAKLPATGPRIGAVLAVAGGPGGSSIDDLEDFTDSFTGLRQRFDVVGFAPRNRFDNGVLPLSCYTSGPWSTQPADQAEYGALAQANRESVRECRRHDPEYFDNLDSASVARDMEAIRAGLGERKLNVIATSYGGMAAVAYARLFPARVRAMFFDGAWDPLADHAESDRLRYPDTERQFQRFADWCRTSTECALHGEDVGSAWRKLVTDADRTPVPAEGELPDAAYTGFDFKIAAGPLIASPGAGWRRLAAGIDLARRGDAAGFVSWVKEGTGAPQVPAAPGREATECADDQGYTDYHDYEEARQRGLRLSPNLAGKWQWVPLMCTGWPRPVANPRRPLPVHDLPPFLGAASDTDGYLETEAFTRRVPGSSAVRYEGAGHGLYLSGVGCVITHADRYFVELKLPPSGTVCGP